MFAALLTNIKNLIDRYRVDGWLLYDFRHSNELACHLLQIPDSAHLTRRFFYWIPARGEPVKIVHAIEPHVLGHLPGVVHTYRSWKELESRIEGVSTGRRVAMEYSPFNANPYISQVDAGTVELVKRFAAEVVSSEELLQHLAVLDEEQLSSHVRAANILDQIASDTWSWLKKMLKSGETITEYTVQQYILRQIAKHGCVTEGLPICAVNLHSADPHYCPQKETAFTIGRGDFVLIDLWCKQELPRAVYGDITRVAVIASEPTKRQEELFSILRTAQKNAVAFVRERFGQNSPPKGWEIDKLCRDFIAQTGYEDFFIHRTGHSIDERTHGSLANLDNFETRDNRQIVLGSCFSVEPGIYLPGEFGLRLEHDVCIHHDGRIEVTGGVQEEITCLS